MTTQKRGRGRPAAPNPRKNKINIYVSDDELAEIDRLRLSEDRSGFCRTLLLRGLHDPTTRYFHYVDSGQADADEAAEWAEAMAEYRRQREGDKEQAGE